MKKIILLMSLFVSAYAMAQKPVFKALLDPKMHAGCYIESGKKTIANLSETGANGEQGALFNINGQDLFFKAGKGDAQYPDLYTNGDYKIYVKDKLGKKDPNSCLEAHSFAVKLVYKGVTYLYRFKGFCGC
jgi:hypothetical protein